MASAEKFCLRWNDFESNISVAFRELREEKDFFDVTLACEDSQVSAHKVILSACSPFFRSILRKNPHAHPLLYLKGVKYQEMLSVLNFMYQGEVNVAQEELNSFLAVAEELRVKGLTQNTQEGGKQRETPPARDPVPPPKRPRPAPPPVSAAPTPRQVFSQHHRQEEESEVQEIEEVQTVKAEPREQQSYQESQSYAGGNQESAVALEDGYQEEYGDYAQYEGQYDAIDPNTGLPIADGNKGSGGRVMMGERNENSDLLVRSRMSKVGGEWQCVDCGLKAALNTLYAHVETNHVSVSFECIICLRECKTRNSLLLHRSRYHKGF